MENRLFVLLVSFRDHCITVEMSHHGIKKLATVSTFGTNEKNTSQVVIMLKITRSEKLRMILNIMNEGSAEKIIKLNGFCQ
jgi:hypothetical protein